MLHTTERLIPQFSLNLEFPTDLNEKNDFIYFIINVKDKEFVCIFVRGSDRLQL